MHVQKQHLCTSVSRRNLMPLLSLSTLAHSDIYCYGNQKNILGARAENQQQTQCNVWFHFHNIQTWGTLIIVWMCMHALTLALFHHPCAAILNPTLNLLKGL